MKYEEVIEHLKAHSSPSAVEGMARFGINPTNTLGVPIPIIRKMAKEIGRDHSLAHELWGTGIHEARILAAMVDNPEEVSPRQMEDWVNDFDSWDVCDQVCSNLFDRTSVAHQKAMEWSSRKEEFVKRAGFALMASLAVHDKNASNSEFQKFLPLIERESTDDRNFVRKAVNWALRQIGKRNATLNRLALKTARQIQETDSRSAKWIAADAIRELTNPKLREKPRRKR
jgi:3-methyladenine DNA glycosylase AlkD